MANESQTIDDLLKRRRLTRAVADIARGRMERYLATLTPLLRPRRTFGEHVHGDGGDVARNSDSVVKELTALHERLVGARPFNLRTPLTLPIRLSTTTLDLTPLEYTHTTGPDHGSR